MFLLILIGLWIPFLTNCSGKNSKFKSGKVGQADSGNAAKRGRPDTDSGTVLFGNCALTKKKHPPFSVIDGCFLYQSF